jgi:hypothetical protein
MTWQAGFQTKPRTGHLLYRFDPEGQPPNKLRLKVEINTREHFAVFGF